MSIAFPPDREAGFSATRLTVMIDRKFWRLFLILLLPALSMASTLSRFPNISSVVDRERQLWREPVRESQFADVPHTSIRARCEQTQPPEALTTPNPILEGTDPSVRVKVSFIVGTDGRVHSPLILESAGSTDDRTVLETVRAWRYRPGRCNGVPTETEGKIEFSSR
jgi:TonB family protein